MITNGAENAIRCAHVRILRRMYLYVPTQATVPHMHATLYQNSLDCCIAYHTRYVVAGCDPMSAFTYILVHYQQYFNTRLRGTTAVPRACITNCQNDQNDQNDQNALLLVYLIPGIYATSTQKSKVRHVSTTLWCSGVHHTGRALGGSQCSLPTCWASYNQYRHF